MACPATLNMTDVTGSYTVNKTLSDDPETSMALRGVAWPMRKAMKVGMMICSFTTITKLLTPHSTTPHTYHPTRYCRRAKDLDRLRPWHRPMKAHDEVQRLDWEWNERKNPLLGTIKARCKLMPWEETKEEYLREGWCEPTVMWGEEISEKEGWETVNVWGFMLIDGERRYVRKTWIKNKKGEENTTRVIHDYKPIAA